MENKRSITKSSLCFTNFLLTVAAIQTISISKSFELLKTFYNQYCYTIWTLNCIITNTYLVHGNQWRKSWGCGRIP